MNAVRGSRLNYVMCIVPHDRGTAESTLIDQPARDVAGVGSFNSSIDQTLTTNH